MPDYSNTMILDIPGIFCLEKGEACFVSTAKVPRNLTSKVVQSFGMADQ